MHQVIEHSYFDVKLAGGLRCVSYVDYMYVYIESERERERERAREHLYFDAKTCRRVQVRPLHNLSIYPWIDGKLSGGQVLPLICPWTQNIHYTHHFVCAALPERAIFRARQRCWPSRISRKSCGSVEVPRTPSSCFSACLPGTLTGCKGKGRKEKKRAGGLQEHGWIIIY
jgi:hypothetical protein